MCAAIGNCLAEGPVMYHTYKGVCAWGMCAWGVCAWGMCAWGVWVGNVCLGMCGWEWDMNRTWMHKRQVTNGGGGDDF